MPTTDRSSPTTTSAVNEKRRPPLTTFATRLISTTRSCRSSPAAETVLSRAISQSRVAALNRQPALAGAFGERLNTPVILVTAAIEHRVLDSSGLCALGEEGAGASRLLHRF